MSLMRISLPCFSLAVAGLLATAMPVAWAQINSPAAVASTELVTPDGGRYVGPRVNGFLEGHGRIDWPNGNRYEGAFHQGLYDGKGLMQLASGQVYEGEFKAGQFHGRGKYSSAQEVYEGDFVRNEFTGQGVYTRSGGIKHVGWFRAWRPNGPGVLTVADGSVYEGEFTDGEPTGVMRYTAADQSRYEGPLQNGLPHGEGVLKLANGDVYQGQFEHGQFSGPGVLTYAQPQSDGRTEDRGLWQFGRLKRDLDNERASTRDHLETALYTQADLLRRALTTVQPRRKGINLYVLAVAGDGSQEVFRREVQFVLRQFDEHMGTRGHSVALINSRSTVGQAPMASVTSIRQTLMALAKTMNKDRDILLLFITSHGSRDHAISLGLEGMTLPSLTAVELGQMLKATQIRHKVVVVSACYAGGFADALRDPGTLFIAAARRDRTSFGCADENDFTYFGRAFFKESLPQSQSFQEAFGKATRLIAQWETAGKPLTEAEAVDEEPTTASDEPVAHDQDRLSHPQMENPPLIEAHLKRWWRQRSMVRGRGHPSP